MLPMLQVQEKAPQAAEEASRNINKGASEVRWSPAPLHSVPAVPATHPASVAGAQSASAPSTIQTRLEHRAGLPWPC